MSGRTVFFTSIYIIISYQSIISNALDYDFFEGFECIIVSRHLNMSLYAMYNLSTERKQKLLFRQAD